MRRYQKIIPITDQFDLSILAHPDLGRRKPFEIAVRKNKVVFYGRIFGLDMRDGIIANLSAKDVRSIIEDIQGEAAEHSYRYSGI